MLDIKKKTIYKYTIYDCDINRDIGEIYYTTAGGWYLELNERCCGINYNDVKDIFITMTALDIREKQDQYFKHQKELLDGNN